MTLGIDLEVWDCEQEYRETVVDYLVDAYAHGYTPNPDVMCNQTVKFGTFAERAFAEGADYVATGHYARVEHGRDGAPAHLLRSADEHKDQTYFMWRVPGAVYNRALFPIGGYANKADVRAACAERGLGIENKPDSDGICFIGPVGLRTFLLDTLDRRAGDVVEWETGKVLGRHDGAFLFTVGQRRGLDLGGGPARYVVGTDTEANVVYVTADTSCPALWTQELVLEDAHWVAGEPPAAGEYVVRMRHTGPLVAAQVTPTSATAQAGNAALAGNDASAEAAIAPEGATVAPAGGATLEGAVSNPAHTAALPTGTSVTVRFSEPVRTVAPGQSVVVYDGLCCLGGGIVSKGDVRWPVAR